MYTPYFLFIVFFFLMIRRPPRSTLDRSSAASDVYKRQCQRCPDDGEDLVLARAGNQPTTDYRRREQPDHQPVSYTHLRAHETVLDLVCRLLLEKKNPSIANDT